MESVCLGKTREISLSTTPFAGWSSQVFDAAYSLPVANGTQWFGASHMGADQGGGTD